MLELLTLSPPWLADSLFVWAATDTNNHSLHSTNANAFKREGDFDVDISGWIPGQRSASSGESKPAEVSAAWSQNLRLLLR
jgi:hypothetical protein